MNNLYQPTTAGGENTSDSCNLAPLDTRTAILIAVVMLAALCLGTAATFA